MSIPVGIKDSIAYVIAYYFQDTFDAHGFKVHYESPMASGGFVEFRMIACGLA